MIYFIYVVMGAMSFILFVCSFQIDRLKERVNALEAKFQP